MIDCTCGHLLVESESSQNFYKWRLDALLIPHCANRDVSKEMMKEFTIVSYEIQNVGWTEQKCMEMDKLAQEDHSNRLSREEHFEISKTLVSHTEQIGARMHRCDFNRTSELQSQTRTVSTENQEKNVQNLFFFNNIKDGTFLSSSYSWWNWDTSKSLWSS